MAPPLTPTSVPNVSVRFREMTGDRGAPAVSTEVFVGRRFVGNIDALYDREMDAFSVRISGIEQSAQGKGVGTAAYLALRDYVKQKHGKPLASDTKRSDQAERLWSRLATAGKAKKSQSGDYYVTEVWRKLAEIAGVV